MRREIHKWWSPNLNKEMEIAVYGHYGYALLMFPTAAADFLEYERFNLIDSISWFINEGKVKAFSINSINKESWLNRQMHPSHRAIRHQQYNNYITEEVLPFIVNNCKGLVPVVNTGSSLGAFHAANTFFRRPDLFTGLIAMSGTYDIKTYSDGYFDDNCYFNSPLDYLPNIADHNQLEEMRKSKIIISSGQGDYEDPSSSVNLSNILNSKGVNHWLDLWGHDIKHEWTTWRKMLPYFLSKINF